MATPRMKGEHNPELALSNTSTKSRGTIAALFAASPTHRERDDYSERTRPKYTPRPLPLRVYQDAGLQPSAAKIKTKLINKDHVVAAVPAPATDREVQPQHSKFVGPHHVSGRHGTHVLPEASWLSSRSVSESKQTPIFTTTLPQNNILATYFRPHLPRAYTSQYPLPPCTDHIQRVTRMDGFGFGGDDGFGGGQELDFNGFGAYNSVQGKSCILFAPCADHKLTVIRSPASGDSAFRRIPETPVRRSARQLYPGLDLLILHSAYAEGRYASVIPSELAVVCQAKRPKCQGRTA